MCNRFFDVAARARAARDKAGCPEGAPDNQLQAEAGISAAGKPVVYHIHRDEPSAALTAAGTSAPTGVRK
jgi:hypothetical protein